MGDIGPKKYGTGVPESAPASKEQSDSQILGESKLSPTAGSIFRRMGEEGADVHTLIEEFNALGSAQMAEGAYEGEILSDVEIDEPRHVTLANGRRITYTRSKRGVFTLETREQ